MTRLASVAIAFAVATAVLVGPAAATASAAPNQLGCRYEKGGSWWAGEWVRLEEGGVREGLLQLVPVAVADVQVRHQHLDSMTEPSRPITH